MWRSPPPPPPPPNPLQSQITLICYVWSRGGEISRQTYRCLFCYCAVEHTLTFICSFNRKKHNSSQSRITFAGRRFNAEKLLIKLPACNLHFISLVQCCITFCISCIFVCVHFPLSEVVFLVKWGFICAWDLAGFLLRVQMLMLMLITQCKTQQSTLDGICLTKPPNNLKTWGTEKYICQHSLGAQMSWICCRWNK